MRSNPKSISLSIGTTRRYSINTSGNSFTTKLTLEWGFNILILNPNKVINIPFENHFFRLRVRDKLTYMH